MLLTNHVLTGIFLGLSIDNEAVLFPAAVASHLAMDVVPHFGLPASSSNAGFKRHLFIVIGSMDFLASIVVLGAFCVAKPERSGHIVIGAIGAALPDLTYIPEIVFGKRIYRLVPWLKRLIYGFLGPIQRFESPIATVVDVGWAWLMLRTLGLLA